jgi:serine/threonine protein kinase/tetratricopeptide (TPR) repeat protein
VEYVILDGYFGASPFHIKKTTHGDSSEVKAMTGVAACPSPEELRELALGLLSEAASEARAAHVEQCSACLAALRNLQVQDPLLDALAQPTASQARQDDQEIQTLLDRLRAVPVLHMVSATCVSPGETSSSNAGPTPAPGRGAAANDFSLAALLAAPQRPDELGRLGPYRVLKVLGRGGMGMVFEAHDPQLDRHVALKALLPSLAAFPPAHERFLREARAAAALDHDHIVHIYQVGEDRGIPYLAMQFLQGESLAGRLARLGPLPVAEVLRIGRETAAGLAAAHARGLVHRDIKPANLWLEGERGRVKILDFGLAQVAGADKRLTQSDAVVGTPGFMAPEQSRGATVDARCDLFSLGCVLYQMCTGQTPFPGNNPISAMLAAATQHPPKPSVINPQVPPSLSGLVMHLLEKDPRDRPGSAQEVRDALEAIEGGQTELLARAPRTGRPAARPPKKRRWLIAGALLGLLVLGGTGYGLLRFLEADETGGKPAASQSGKDKPGGGVGKTAPSAKDKPGGGVGKTAPGQGDPKTAEAHLHLGLAHAKTKEYEKAIAEFDTALRLNPGHAGTYSTRGWTYHLMSQNGGRKPRSKIPVPVLRQKAIADLSTAIGLRPQNPLFYNTRGTIYRQQKKFDRAIADFDQVIRLRPRRALGYANRGWTEYLMGKFHRAVADLDKAIQFNSGLSQAYFDRGRVYASRGQFPQALADFTEAIRCEPGRGGFYVYRGSVYFRKGDEKEALADLNKGIRLAPRYARGYFWRSKVYRKQGEQALADADFAKAVQLDPALAKNKQGADSKNGPAENG